MTLDIQQTDIRQNDNQKNDIHQNNTQQNDTQQNETNILYIDISDVQDEVYSMILYYCNSVQRRIHSIYQRPHTNNQQEKKA